MGDNNIDVIDVSRLRIGHFVYIDLSWISHPFPLNSFKIHSQEQIDAIRTLGIDRIRYSPERSDPEPAAAGSTGVPQTHDSTTDRPHDNTTAQSDADHARRAILADQNAGLKACEREFTSAIREYRALVESLRTKPTAAFTTATNLVTNMSAHLIGAGEVCIRLLSEKVGERASHEINVTVISLLLGNTCGLDKPALHELGLGALLHDIGKIDLPDRLRYASDNRSPAEEKIYQQHVPYGIALGRNMALPPGALTVIAQHHENADGSGYPKKLRNAALSPAARIVALADYYDTLCNPANPVLAMTPHEALSRIFTLRNARFDESTVNTFIRMMGVYPPGSVVHLSDDRYALVISVNAQRPLKPRVVIHEPNVPREEALVVDLADCPDIGLRRSLRPLQLPRAAYDYLSPRTRICYFFERGRGTGDDGGAQ
ncbi:HD-GYP domain-containing protein [Azoarcus sp. KH32C]|uniref:HD-GYP domain-containing protein n=1 Tax=Azoarcus sp. KH32C TaxID=748247 RepID=UPI0002386841|nr:HD-GYP domain-containing protein [Azoarcus sp. KH32C]BAL24761.1 metal dependent phosphohydrolase [Azoarcus sp. KH32C]